MESLRRSRQRSLSLGIRVVNEPPPTDYVAATVKVDYDEKSWRATITQSFRDICKILSRERARPSRENLELALNALHRIAAHASIQAKETDWAVERNIDVWFCCVTRASSRNDYQQLVRRLNTCQLWYGKT